MRNEQAEIRELTLEEIETVGGGSMCDFATPAANILGALGAVARGFGFGDAAFALYEAGGSIMNACR